MLKDLIDMVNDGTISSKQGKEVLFKCLDESKEPKVVVEESGMKQIGSTDEILKIVTEVLDENGDNIEKYKAGRTNVVDFLVGQVMKKTRGQANPSITRSMMIEEIEKR
jgi:aspartyl-tRNA(Asn)/glutamyl-tRNA(Gln) amidotransferase subunit B